jgi:hypothetical protein
MSFRIKASHELKSIGRGEMKSGGRTISDPDRLLPRSGNLAQLKSRGFCISYNSQIAGMLPYSDALYGVT